MSDWPAAEVAIRAHIVAQWSEGDYAAVPLLWENETAGELSDTFVLVSIEGNFSKKSVIGSSGLRFAQDHGHVFVHAFVPQGVGKTLPNALVNTVCRSLELRQLGSGINMDGAHPPSPADPGDIAIPSAQPGGNYYRVTGSVPFVVISSV